MKPSRFCPSDFEALLTLLFQKSSDEPLVLVPDEYPYLRSAASGLDSILQALIDRFRDSSQLHLILCGSFADTFFSPAPAMQQMFSPWKFTTLLSSIP